MSLGPLPATPVQARAARAPRITLVNATSSCVAFDHFDRRRTEAGPTVKNRQSGWLAPHERVVDDHVTVT